MRHELRDGPGRHGDVPHRPRADRRLHADGIAHRGGRHHVGGLRFPDRGQAARRGPGHQHADAGGPRAVAAGDHRHPADPGVPAAPERLQVRRRPRGEARAPAEGLGHGRGQQLRPHVQQPGQRDGREPRAAAAGARGARFARRLGRGPGDEVRAAGLHDGARLSAPGLPAARGRLAAAGVAGARLPGVHGARPDARPAAGIRVVRLTAAGVERADGRHTRFERPRRRSRSGSRGTRSSPAIPPPRRTRRTLASSCRSRTSAAAATSRTTRATFRSTMCSA